MYCRYCGKKLSDDAVICTGCRRPVEPTGVVSTAPGVGVSWSFATMVTLIVATLPLPPVGLIAGAIGLRNDAKRAQGAVLMTVGVFASLFWLAIILGL